MKFRIVENAWWMRWARGMVFWPWVWMRYLEVPKNPQSAYERAQAKQFEEWNIKLFLHELEHCYQAQELGRLKFLWRWVTLRLRYSYEDHPMEQHKIDDIEPVLTDLQRKWYETGRIDLSEDRA